MRSKYSVTRPCLLLFSPTGIFWRSASAAPGTRPRWRCSYASGFQKWDRLDVPAANLHQQVERPLGVLFIRNEVCVDVFFLAEEVLRPMALLACFLSRTQIFNGSRNRAWILVEQDGIDLIRSGNFRTDKPVGPGSECGTSHTPHVRGANTGRQYIPAPSLGDMSRRKRSRIR